MNYTAIYLGSVPNDHTGDTIRGGGTKINSNFQELFWASPQRHRQSPLVYLQTGGAPDYFTYNVTVGPGNWVNSVTVTLKAPFVAAIGSGSDERGERNLSAVLSADQTPAGWNLSHDGGFSGRQTYTRYLWIERNFSDLTLNYGFSTLSPVSDQTAPSSPSTDQHWFDKLTGVMKRWNGTTWVIVYRLFITTFIFNGPGTPDSVVLAGTGTFTYSWDNDELIDMRREALKAALIFGS